MSTQVELVPAGASDRTALYRLYDAEGELLYVGITRNPERRFAEHAADKPWWPLVTRRNVEWYEKRKHALAAKEAAIKKHEPYHNRDHSPNWPSVRFTMEMSVNQQKAVELLARSITATGSPPPVDWILWCLLDRELSARGLFGDAPCYQLVNRMARWRGSRQGQLSVLMRADADEGLLAIRPGSGTKVRMSKGVCPDCSKGS